MRTFALLALLTVGCSSPSSMSDGGATDGGVPAGSDIGTANAVKLRSPSYTFDGTIYSIDFVVDDTVYPTRTIASIDGLSLLWPGGSADAPSFQCTQPPWIVPAETTGTIELQLGAGGNTTLLAVGCGMPNTQQPFELAGMAAPGPGDSILIEVDGKLDDATPFRAVTAANTQ